MELRSSIHQYSKKAITLILAIISIAITLWLNYQIILGWFGKLGPASIGSIEVSYVSMGKFILDLGFGTWAPFWYFGFPFHVFYTPLLPLCEAFLNYFIRMPLWESYRFLTGWAYVLGPVSVFFLGWQMSKRVIGGLVAGVFYSVGPTIFYFILKSGEVAADRVSAEFWDPRRFTILVRWGEGPHLFSLIFMPLVGVFFARYLEKPKVRELILTCIFLGLTALTNAIGLFAAILLLGSMSFAKFAQTNDAKNFTRFILAGIVSLGLVSFWYNLTFISTFLREGSSSILLSMFPWGWLGGGGLIILIYYIAKNLIKNFAIASSLLWFLTFFAIVGVYYMSAPPDESFRRVELLPQALRYNVEVDLALSVFLGVLFAGFFTFLGRYTKFANWLGILAGAAVVGGVVFYVRPFLPTAFQASSQVVDLNSTAEKSTADWFASHVDQTKGERVLAPGNYGFYLNWFNYVWQLRGGLFQAATHHWPDHIYYQLANGQDPQIAKAWLVASNIKYALITTGASRELYKEFKNLDRFTAFKEAYNEQGDIIYETPLKRPSMAKPVNISPMQSLVTPIKADDKKNLLIYTNWVENSSTNELDFKALSFNKYQVKGKIDGGEGILVQMTADAGWSAHDSGGNGIKMGKDPLGFLMLYPKSGVVAINLEHHTSWQEWLGYLVSLLIIGLFVVYRLFRGKKYNLWLSKKS